MIIYIYIYGHKLVVAFNSYDNKGLKNRCSWFDTPASPIYHLLSWPCEFSVLPAFSKTKYTHQFSLRSRTRAPEMPLRDFTGSNKELFKVSINFTVL